METSRGNITSSNVRKAMDAADQARRKHATMWMQTYTGRQFYPLDPDPAAICIEDIAHALAMKCRYAGHCQSFFSVAQHSVMVSRMVSEQDALWGLMHDAAEAYLPDVVRPIKGECYFYLSHKTMTPFEFVEQRILIAIANRFDLTYGIPPAIAQADTCCLERERRQLMGSPPEPWWATEQHWDGDTTPIVCWTWQEAQRQFLHRFDELTARTDGAS